MFGVKRDEKDISATQQEEKEKAWIPRQNEHSRRQKRAEKPQSQGTPQTDSGNRQQVTGKFLFDRTRRIRKRREYLRLKQHGRRFYSGNFIFSYVVKDEGVSRLGIVVRKKLLKRAVWRNRIKRLIREVFRLRQYDFVKPVDVVVIVRGDDLLSVRFDDVERAFLQFITYVNRKHSGRGEDS